jgi:hypothetical protein
MKGSFTSKCCKQSSCGVVAVAIDLEEEEEEQEFEE